MENLSHSFNEQMSWISSFVSQSETSFSDWKKYSLIVKQMGRLLRDKTLTDFHKDELRKALAPVITTSTMQGHIYLKPHGYAGDFEIIDKFYTQYKSPDKKLTKWDIYLQDFAAAKAVRNRKEYIKTLLKTKSNKQADDSTFEMLNLASGPARDLYEFFVENPSKKISIDCIDLDNNAIKYAQRLLGEYNDNVNFINKNILRFSTEKKYDLIWSAGLFDYFDDTIFKRLITRFIKNVKPGGEMVVGNFCSTNPDIEYMEILDWILYHRNKEDLIKLVADCGISPDNISVEKEPEGVNLFVRIKV